MTALAIKGDVCAAIRSVLQPGDWAIDGGAGDGTETRTMAELVGPSGRVLSFEPDARRADELTKIARGYACVRYHQAALGRWSGSCGLHCGLTPDTSSVYKSLVAQASATQTVPMVSLDTVADPRVRAVKLDLQGHECAVLDGATRLLTMKPTWIVECWPHGLGAAGSSARDLLARFRGAGYIVQWMGGAVVEDEPFDHWVENVREGFCNLIAVPA